MSFFLVSRYFVYSSNTNKIKISKTIVHSTEFNELNVKSLSRMDRVIALFKALHEPSLVRKTPPPLGLYRENEFLSNERHRDRDKDSSYAYELPAFKQRE